MGPPPVCTGNAENAGRAESTCRKRASPQDRKALRNYASQYVPTVGGKIANIIDDTKRTTKSAASSKESFGGTVLDQYGRSIAQKIPGLSFTNEPYVTVKGERITQDNFGEWALEFANQFSNPPLPCPNVV